MRRIRGSVWAPAALVLVLWTGGEARAQPDGRVTLRGRLGDRRAEGVVRAPAGLGGTRRIRVADRWEGELQPVGSFAWRGRVAAPDAHTGLADRVESPAGDSRRARVAPLVVTYVALPGLRPRAQLYRDGRSVGLLASDGPPVPVERPEPTRADATATVPRFEDFDGALGADAGTAPGAGADPGGPGSCELRRDAWWARHSVATWTVGRALWDLFKPGGRGLTELRGDVTWDGTGDLRAALAPSEADAPLSAATIYRAARARTDGDREALRLAFGLLVDRRDLALRRLPGLGPDAPLHDKYVHFFASAILAHRGNAQGSFAVGWLKEVLDEIAPDGSGYSEADLLADALGAEFGRALHCGEVLEY